MTFSLHQKQQRVAVFLDVQNLYYSAQAIYGRKINFQHILEDVVADRQLIRAIAYAVRAENPDEQTFFSALEKIGIEVKTKDLQIFYGGHKKADWDVGIAMDALKHASKVDTVILCSGDGDFRELVEYLQFHGCRVEVAAFGKSTSHKLRDVADSLLDFDQQAERYLLSARRGAGRASANATIVTSDSDQLLLTNTKASGSTGRRSSPTNPASVSRQKDGPKLKKNTDSTPSRPPNKKPLATERNRPPSTPRLEYL